MCEGLDTRELIESYSNLKKEHKSLQASSKLEIGNLTTANNKLTRRVNATMKRLE